MYIQPALAAPGPLSESDSDSGEVEPEPDDHTHTPAHHEPAEDYEPLPRPSALLLTVIALGLVATVALGVYPAPLLELIEGASAAILPGG
jgi:hypothetical protein